MRGRFAGLIGSAILSTLSLVLFFYPGLNLGVDFRGGVVVELRGPQALQVDKIREAFAPLGFDDLRVQEFGSPQDVLVRFENKAQLQDAQRMIASRVAEALPGVQIRGPRSSAPGSAANCSVTACSRPVSPSSRC
jgi:preprotein translocase subunit SecF